MDKRVIEKLANNRPILSLHQQPTMQITVVAVAVLCLGFLSMSAVEAQCESDPANSWGYGSRGGCVPGIQQRLGKTAFACSFANYSLQASPRTASMDRRHETPL